MGDHVLVADRNVSGLRWVIWKALDGFGGGDYALGRFAGSVDMRASFL